MTALRELFAWLQHESITVAGYPLPWIEVIGSLFGFAAAILGMRRKVWAWPVGIIGNLLLLTVFLGSALSPDPSLPHLLGQAGRQIMFIAVAIWSRSGRKTRGVP